MRTAPSARAPGSEAMVCNAPGGRSDASGASHASMLKVVPCSASIAILASSASAKAATARLPSSRTSGGSVNPPKISNSNVICAASFSLPISRHSSGKSVIVTCWPCTTGAGGGPPLLTGQSLMICPGWPHKWQARVSPTLSTSLPSGCVYKQSLRRQVQPSLHTPFEGSSSTSLPCG